MAKPVPPINDPGKLPPAKASKAATALSIAERIHASVDALRKVHGQDSIVSLAKGVVPGAAAQGVISTGSLSIDLAIGIGGIPRGRITEVFGPNSAGKTTLALHCIAEAQKSGGTCAFIDAEHALDVRYAQALGVKIDDDALLFSQPSSGEQALELVEGLARAGVMLIVVDSVAMLTPQKEVAGDFGDAQMGAHARLMSQAMRKLISAVAKGGSTLLFLNQIRMKLGVMYGSPEVTTGGQALPYAASVRIDVRRRAQVKDGTDAVGNVTDIKIVKNKCAPPFKECSLEIIWGRGFNREGDLISAALELGVLSLSGTWFSYGELRLGQGSHSAAAKLVAEPKLFAEIRKKCLKEMGIT